jgi:hypothetical protein
MRLLVEYFGFLIFGFVTLVAALVALPPSTSTGEVLGLGLALVVISGGFTWYYNADLPAGAPARRSDRPNEPSDQ